MTFPQYVSLLKSRAHELDTLDAKSSYARLRYQSIHPVESDGQSDRDGHRGRSGQRKGCGRGGRGSDDTDREDECGQEDYINQDEDYIGQDEDYVSQEDYYGQEGWGDAIPYIDDNLWWQLPSDIRKMIAEARYNNNNEEFKEDNAESTTSSPQNGDTNETETAPTTTTINVNSLRQYRVKHEEGDYDYYYKRSPVGYRSQWRYGRQ